MASENLIACFEAKLDALAVTHKAELAMLRAEVPFFRWLIVAGPVLPTFLETVLQPVIDARDSGQPSPSRRGRCVRPATSRKHNVLTGTGRLHAGSVTKSKAEVVLNRWGHS